MAKNHLAFLRKHLKKIPPLAKLTVRLFGRVTQREHLLIQEYHMKKGNFWTGKTKTDIARDTGVIVTGTKKAGKRFGLNVPFQKRLKPGTYLLMGTNSELNSFEKKSKSKR